MLAVVLGANEQVDEILKPSGVLPDVWLGDFRVDLEDVPFEEGDA